MYKNFLSFFQLIDKKLKRDFFINIIGAFVVMLFEIFSIAMIFPAIGFLLNEDISESNLFMKTDIAKFIFVTFRDFPIKHLIIYFLIFFGVLYLLKVITTLYFAWRNSKFSFNVRTFLAVKLNQLYINQPFSFHISNNSSKIIHNLTQEINIIAQGCNSLLIFITEFAVLIGLLFFFIIYQPFITFILILIFLPAIFFFRKIKIFVSELSKTRQYHDSRSIFIISQAFSGIKELFIVNKSHIFTKNYIEHVSKSSSVNTKNSFITHLPRNILELLLIFGIVLISLYLPLQEENFKIEILKIMAVFAIASFRIMPALTRIAVATNVLSYMFPVLETYYKLHQKLSKKQKPILERKKYNFKTIKIENLSFSYGKKKIFKNFSLNIEKNQKIGIVGASGSGKTTLINLFLGLLKPTRGGIKLYDKNDRFIKSVENLMISHVPQEVFLFDDTLMENICMSGTDRINHQLLKKVIKESDLEEVVRKLPMGLKSRMGERGSKISGGQKQRVGIARSLYHQTDLLIFDEITSSLDTKSESNIIELISRIRDKTIILITHKKKNLNVCDKVIDLNNIKLK
ncbi:MAG: hypothetical protein CMA12_00435 [Euryarchaeota archaeon]|nr:hypothetical protein [Euryarchaeota archaeon]